MSFKILVIVRYKNGINNLDQTRKTGKTSGYKFCKQKVKTHYKNTQFNFKKRRPTLLYTVNTSTTYALFSLSLFGKKETHKDKNKAHENMLILIYHVINTIII